MNRDTGYRLEIPRRDFTTKRSKRSTQSEWTAMENTRQRAKSRELCVKRETFEFRHRIFRPSSDETASIVSRHASKPFTNDRMTKKRNATKPEGRRSKGRCGEREGKSEIHRTRKEKKAYVGDHALLKCTFFSNEFIVALPKNVHHVVSCV